VSVHLGKQK